MRILHPTRNRILLIAGGTLVALIAVELTLRLAHFINHGVGGDLRSRLDASDQASLQDAQGEFSLKGLVEASARTGTVYELKADLRGTFLGKSLETNSHGFRGAETDRDKPAGVFRIAGLGDSVMFGWGVSQGECYLRVLERKLIGLQDGARRFEVLNFAVPGYNTAMEVDVLEHTAIRFDPDLVILHVISNDVDVPLFMREPKRVWMLNRSFLWDLLQDRTGRESSPDSKDVPEQFAYMTGIEGFHAAVERLAGITKRAGVPVVVIRGSLHPMQERVVRSCCSEFGFYEIPIAPYTDEYVRQHGIEDTPAARQRSLHVSDNDRHPNAVAHTIYAEAILDQLAEMNIIDFESDLKPSP